MRPTVNNPGLLALPIKKYVTITINETSVLIRIYRRFIEGDWGMSLSLEERVLDLARREGILRPRDLAPYGIPA